MDLNPADLNAAPEKEQIDTNRAETATEETTEEQQTVVQEEEGTATATETEAATTEEEQQQEVPSVETSAEDTSEEEAPAEEGEDDEEEEEDEEEISDEPNDAEDKDEKKPLRNLSDLDGEALYEAVEKLVEQGVAPLQRDMRRLERQMMPRSSRPAGDESTPEETPEGELVARFINLKSRVQKLRNDLREQEKSERETNLAEKRELIDRLKELLSPTNTMNSITLRNEFFNIRHAWSTIGRVPDNDRNALLDEYAALLDRFYEEKEVGEGDRIQDYADNRAAKEEIIRRAKALTEEKDAVRAFRKMKALLDEWKEVGPVAPEFKDTLWKDFKDAQQVIYKRHDEHFQALHEDEKANYEKKKELVEHLEKMLVDLPTTRPAWRRYEREMRHIQDRWRSIGRVPKELFGELRGRYNLARDEFYMQRKAFLKELSAEITPKLERLRELADEAEALKESEEWSATAEKLKALQREWTENSRFGTQVAEAQRLWRRFRAACDTFFERKTAQHKQQDADRQDNLQAKYDVVDRLEALLDRRNDPDVPEEVKALEAEWRSIGPVPNDQKDDVLNRYYGTMRILTGQGGRRGGGRRSRRDDDGRRDRGRGRGREGRGGERQREPKFTKVNLDKDLTKLSKDDLKDEQANVKHGISKLEEELLQLETNFGFFSGNPDSPMVQHVQRQIDEVKEKIARYEDRVGEIKEEAKKPEEEKPAAEAPAEETAAAEAPAEEAPAPDTKEEASTPDTPTEE